LTADHGLALGVCAKHNWNSNARSDNKTAALVAQLDRAPDFESGGRGFESLRARQMERPFSANTDAGDTVPKQGLGTRRGRKSRPLKPPPRHLVAQKRAKGLARGSAGHC